MHLLAKTDAQVIWNAVPSCPLLISLFSGACSLIKKPGRYLFHCRRWRSFRSSTVHLTSSQHRSWRSEAHHWWSSGHENLQLQLSLSINLPNRHSLCRHPYTYFGLLGHCFSGKHCSYAGISKRELLLSGESFNSTQDPTRFALLM